MKASTLWLIGAAEETPLNLKDVAKGGIHGLIFLEIEMKLRTMKSKGFQKK